MRNILILIVMMASVFVAEGCTITHKFGPFCGKVVDAESGKPIEGAVVAVWFSTKRPSMGGMVWRVADAVETLTDANGEFRISPHRINLFRLMAWWESDCQVSIFKPGYGAYPGNSKTYSSLKNYRYLYLPENKYTRFFLPRLLSLEERKENLSDIEEPVGIDFEKIPHLRKFESEERYKVGLQPYQ